MISIITPNYNCEQWLEPCLDSVANQTAGQDDLEMLIVDDGSTDNSREVIESYRDKIPGLRTIWHEHVGKPSILRNMALDKALGSHVLFLDSDDYLGNEAIERLSSFTEEGAADVVAFQLEGYKRSVPRSMLKETKVDADLVDSGIYKSLGIWKMCRRDFLNEYNIRFDSSLPSADDIPFMAEVLMRAKKISIAAGYPYYTVRGREDGSSLTQAEWGPIERMIVGKKLGELAMSYAATKNVADHFLIRLFNTDALAILSSSTTTTDILEQLRREYSPYWSNRVAQLIYTDETRQILTKFFGDGE